MSEAIVKFEFMDGPWENSREPSLICHREDDGGGDPSILGRFKSLHDVPALYELCRRANASIALTSSAEELAEALREAQIALNGGPNTEGLHVQIESALASYRKAVGGDHA